MSCSVIVIVGLGCVNVVLIVGVGSVIVIVGVGSVNVTVFVFEKVTVGVGAVIVVAVVPMFIIVGKCQSLLHGTEHHGCVKQTMTSRPF